MALFAYLQRTRLLLKDAGFTMFRDGDLASYINTGRGQVAAEGECVRALGTIALTASQQSYTFASITLPAGVGYNSVLTVRQVGTGGILLTPRTWEWLFEYYVAPGVAAGSPVDWAQLGQGTSGSFYLGPTPSTNGSASLDVVIEPIALATDASIEAIPYPFTDAVPYFAAYVALLTERADAAAQNMYLNYERFMLRARATSTPSVLPQQYPGATGAKLAGAATPILPPITVSGNGQQQRAG